MTQNDGNRGKGGSSLLSPSMEDGGTRSGDLQEAIELLSARHRRARSRREASDNPWLQALSSGATDDALARRLHQARFARESRSSQTRPSLLSAPAMDEREPEPDVVPAAKSDTVRARAEDVQDTPAQPQHREFHEYRDDSSERWAPLIDPVAVIRGILTSRKTIAATTIAGALLGVLVALNTPKLYVSTAEILVDPRDIKIADRELTIGALPQDATLAIIENQVRVMYSGPVLQRVVTELGLASDPEFNGSEGGLGLGGLVSAVRGIFSGDGGPAKEGRKTALAVENLAESLTIERGGKTFIVSISAKTKDADKSAKIANKVYTVFMEEAGKIQSGTAGRAESEMGSRLGQLRKTVQEVEQAVETFKTANDLIDAQGRLISDDQIVKINDQLSVARARTIELNAKVRSIRAINADSVVSAALPEYVNSAVLAELRSQYARLKQETDSLSNRLGPRHPRLQAAEAQLIGARRQIEGELQRLADSIQIELKRAVEQEQSLAADMAEAKARQANVSDKLVELRELEREAAAQRAVYENYLLRTRDAGEQKTVNTSNISLISKAEPALLPSGVSRGIIVVAFTILGFLAGVAIGALRGAIASFRSNGSPSPHRSQSAPRRRAVREEPAPYDDMPALVQPVTASHPSAAQPVAAAPAPLAPVQPAMQPAYVQPQMQPAVQPQMQPLLQPMIMPQPPVYAAQPVYPHPVMPQAYMPQPMMHPMSGYWPQPQPVWPQVYAPPLAPAPWPVQTAAPAPAPAPVPAQPAAEETSGREVAELRESLRAMRDKVQMLGERRLRRNS